MTTSEPVARDATLRAAVYCGSPYAAHRDAVEAAVGGIERVEVATVESLGALTAGDGIAGDFALVCADSVVDVPAGPVVWVTTDSDTVRAATDAGVLDVFTWAPTDDGDLLAAQLRHRLDATFGPATSGDSAASASKRVDDGVLTLDRDARITHCNETMAALLERPDAALAGEYVWDHVPESVAADLEPVVERVLTEGVTVGTELSLDEKGQRFVVTAFPSGGGTAIHVRTPSAGTDAVADRGLYEYLIETVGDAVYILDDEGRFTFVNDALCEMTGYERETLVGSSVHIIKDDHTVEEAEDALRDLLRERTSDDGDEGISIAKLDVDLVRKDGEHVPCTDRMTMRPLGEDGSFQGTVGTLRDVSRQKYRENILSGLLEAAGEMVTAETTDEVAENVLETAVEVLDIDLAAVRRYDPDQDGLELVTTTEAVDEVLPDRPVYDPGEGPVGRAFTEGELVVADALDHMPDSPDDVSGGVYLPLGDSRVLSLGQSDGGGFDEDEIRFVELLAATATPVFDRVERDQERRRYEAVIEAADDMLFTLDDEGRFTLVTESFAAALGVDREELRGRSVETVVDDDAVAQALATATECDASIYETDLLTADGERLPGRISVAPIESEIEAGVVGTVRDISDLRSAQREATQQRRRFTELFETLTDPVADLLYADGEAVVRNVNPAFAALVDADDIHDRSLAAVRERLPAGIADALEPVSDTGEAIERNVSTRTDAGERYYLLKTVPYEGDDSQRAFVILTDVTDVKQRETQLQVLYRILRHNLRNRTTVIQGTAEEIASRDESGEIAPLAQRILDASRSLVNASETARTVQGVLEQREPVESAPVERVAADLTDSIGRQYPALGVTVTADTTGTVRYSEDLVTAVLELVDNAVEHGAADPTVEVELTDAPDGGVRVAVHDDGPGVPREEWDIVTGGREITQLQHASGLGLWLVKWVADTHGGTLRLERADEDGSTVAIDLPR